MVSTGVSWDGKTRIYYIDTPRTQVNADKAGVDLKCWQIREFPQRKSKRGRGRGGEWGIHSLADKLLDLEPDKEKHGGSNSTEKKDTDLSMDLSVEGFRS